MSTAEQCAAILIYSKPGSRTKINEAMVAVSDAFIFLRHEKLEKLTPEECMELTKQLGPLTQTLTTIINRIL